MQSPMKYLLIIVAVLLPIQLLAESKVIHIYQDADLSNYHESSNAIQKGIEIAFDEIGNEIDGYKVVYKYLDHRGNVVRSKRNYQTFIDDPKALVIYSGIHSPPLIKNRAFINESKALTLVPWAAGGPITRYPSSENWIFRLSVDDTQAGPVIIDFALNDKGCKNPHLLLEKTPWGDSNLMSMSKALGQRGMENPAITRFSWDLKKKAASALLRTILIDEADCIVLVSNAVEGAVIVGEIAKLAAKVRLPIISHWGITGGNFHERVSATQRINLDLHFIQSCFAFTNSEQTVASDRVFAHLKNYTDGQISQPTDLKAAVGFIHAYDLTKILIQAIRQTRLTGDMAKDRAAIRLALENIDRPVHGLVKVYKKPFSEYSKSKNENAHEALHARDYCMGRYGPMNEVVISGH
jgi:branched-chain amino acid transport system substrate-binding protein